MNWDRAETQRNRGEGAGRVTCQVGSAFAACLNSRHGSAFRTEARPSAPFASWCNLIELSCGCISADHRAPDIVRALVRAFSHWGFDPMLSSSRISTFLTFPVKVIGNWSTRRSRVGILKCAMRPTQKSRTSSTVNSLFARTQTHTSSPKSSWGIPNTAASMMS